MENYILMNLIHTSILCAHCLPHEMTVAMNALPLTNFVVRLA